MIEIIEYDSNYDEDIKGLLLELQEHIASIDREKYNVVTNAYKEEQFRADMQAVQENHGKIFLALADNIVAGLIIGTITEAIDAYDFKAPKSGKVLELVVSKRYRTNGIGQALMNQMETYFKNAGCKRILVEVFEYNELAKRFYDKNNFFNRTIDMMKKL